MRHLLLVLFSGACQHQAEPPPGRVPEPQSRPVTTIPSFDRQIARLADVAEEGIGYSSSMSGAQFLPNPSGDAPGPMRLGESPPVRSTALTELVAAGAEALLALARCVDDATPTRMQPMRPRMWMARYDEYDVNRRTTMAPPGVNLEPTLANTVGRRQASAGYTITVGDLCFVAIGQIVNRSFAAVRYQPTGGLVVNSPASSPALRDAVRDEWGRTTRDSLRASLVHDFREPDDETRRLGALVRLRYYYPDAEKPVVDAELARPIYDREDARSFVRTLYAATPAQRAREFAAYVGTHGPATRDGVEQALFADLETQEAYEQKRIDPPNGGASYHARECLIALYDLPPTVTSKDRPYPNYASKYERERLIRVLGR